MHGNALAASPSSTNQLDGGSPSRTIYAYALDPEACVPGGDLVTQIRAELREHRDSADLDELVQRTASWSQASADSFLALLDGAAGTTERTILIRRAALGCSPLGLVSGAWLQWLSAPGNAEDPITLRILALYAGDIGVGQPLASRGNAYLELLQRLRAAENAMPAGRLTRDSRIAELAFRLPALLMLMSRRPDDFRDELLGADLCLRVTGLLPALAIVRRVLPKAVDWSAIDPANGRQPGQQTSAALCRSAVDGLLAAGNPEAADAVRTGFSWTLDCLRSWMIALHEQLVDALDPDLEMAELLRERAREGAVYHHRFSLEGRPLASWLAESRSDPGPLLAALAKSKLIKPGRSEASPLVRGLVSERGPMFRVFSPDDLVTISRWIDSLHAPTVDAPSEPDLGQPQPAEEDRPGGVRLARIAQSLKADQPIQPVPRDLRSAYHMLMSRTDSPAVRAWSQAYVNEWLDRCRRGLATESSPLPADWKPEGLRSWLQAQHDQHGAEFQESADVPLPSQEAVVGDTLQTAPLTLIDGSWLQGFTDYEQASSAIGHSLFQTYWDELGNGEPALNHPIIYRQVLAEMDLQLPSTASIEFARWPGLRDSSFELPVYWLCIGRFPRTFLPEILGLNLAMELSGVGGSYRRARQALKHYGFSTRFVDIHNTIDNVATGHSAWAADAVDTLLAGLSVTPGPNGRDATWQRVRVGYRSLNPPPKTRRLTVQSLRASRLISRHSS